MRKEFGFRSGGRLFPGVVITAIGVIFLLNNLGIIEAREVLRLRVWFFPILLIAFGVLQLLRRRSSQ